MKFKVGDKVITKVLPEAFSYPDVRYNHSQMDITGVITKISDKYIVYNEVREDLLIIKDDESNNEYVFHPINVMKIS